VRENGSTTRAVSVSELDGEPAEVRDARFLAAKADDGSLALFTSRHKLTDDATSCASCEGDLYLWDGGAVEGERLTDLTTADPQGGRVLGMAEAADDLSRVFFVAHGDLAEGAAGGQPNLYQWTPGEGIRHVATLAGSDTAVWNTNRQSADRYRDARISADGTRLLFASRAQVTAQDTGGTKQIYLYDASTDRLVCVSCPASVPSGDSWLFYSPTLDSAPRVPYRLPRNLSGDGERVFFETAQGLVGRDTNAKPDVYMWSGGELSLVSTGKGGEASEFVDASASGDDVFFTTRERLVGADVDDHVDIYDARVGGGFPEQQVPPECIGDACQGLPAAVPDLSDPVGGSLAGDRSAPRRPLVRVRGLSVGQRRALAAGRRVRLVVRVNRPGRVVVRGIARVGKREKTVIRAARRVRGAGSVRLGLRLSKGGRRQLAQAGRLVVSFGVRFGSASRRLSVGLVRPSKDGRGR
jgi:hypothetical protein